MLKPQKQVIFSYPTKLLLFKTMSSPQSQTTSPRTFCGLLQVLHFRLHPWPLCQLRLACAVPRLAEMTYLEPFVRDIQPCSWLGRLALLQAGRATSSPVLGLASLL